jgi:hypothetical protein
LVYLSDRPPYPPGGHVGPERQDELIFFPCPSQPPSGPHHPDRADRHRAARATVATVVAVMPNGAATRPADSLHKARTKLPQTIRPGLPPRCPRTSGHRTPAFRHPLTTTAPATRRRRCHRPGNSTDGRGRQRVSVGRVMTGVIANAAPELELDTANKYGPANHSVGPFTRPSSSPMPSRR